MSSRFDVGPYDPCPCGSGAKYKFCCAAKARANRRGKFPIGTVCYYGPDDKTTTKIAAGVILGDNAEPILERFVGTNVINDPKVAEQVKRFFARHGVKSVAITDGNLGCPHEEGSDFPEGADCPFCPFWAGKQGTARRDHAEDEWEEDDEAPDDDKEEKEERDWDAAFARADAILGGREVEDLDGALDLMLAHLRKNLQLPCEVTGIEDFQWEEPYILGGWSPAEYRRLKKTQPSYTDRFQLIALSRDEDSEWRMSDEDIAARVRRISDGREFVLGLAELEATDKHSRNYQLLDDYAVWFANSR